MAKEQIKILLRSAACTILLHYHILHTNYISSKISAPPPCKEPHVTSFPQNLVIKIHVLLTHVLLITH